MLCDDTGYNALRGTQIGQFLDVRRVKSPDADFNFVGMPPFQGKFNVTPADIPDLFKHMDSYYNNHKYALTLAERQTDTSGLFLDLDIYLNDETPIDDDSIDHVIENLADVLKNTLENTNSLKFNVLVSRRCEVTQDPKSVPIRYREGIHLRIPDVIVPKSVKAEIIKKLHEDIIDEASLGGEVDYEKTSVDKASGSVPVLLYNCTRNKKRSYKIHSAFTVKAVRRGVKVTPMEIKSNDYKFILDTFNLNNSVLSRVNYVPVDKSLLIVETPAVNASDVDREMHSNYRENDMEYVYISDLLDLLNPERYNNYTYWRSILCILHAKKDDKYKLLAKIFSMKSNKYSDGEFNQHWNSIDDNTNKYTLSTLYYYCTRDNLVGLRNLQNNTINAQITKFVYDNYKYNYGLVDRDIADIFQYIYSDTLVFSTLRGGKSEEKFLHQYNIPKGSNLDAESYKWTETESLKAVVNNFIMNKLNKHLKDVHRSIIIRRDSILEKIQDKEELKIMTNYYKKLINGLNAVIAAYGNGSKIPSVTSVLEYTIYRERFHENFDKEPYTFGVKNGIVQFDSDVSGCVTIKHIKSHNNLLISRYMSASYIPFDKDNKDVRRVFKLLSDNFLSTDLDAFNYIMFYMSSCLFNDVKNPLMAFLIGAGSNGKSFMIYLLTELFNAVKTKGYSSSFPVSFLYHSTKDANGHDTKMIDLVHARFGVFNEGNKESPLNATKIKTILGGGDKISIREIYKSSRICTPKAGFAFVGNHYPPIEGSYVSDEGFWRRVAVFPFKIKYCNRPTEPNERKGGDKVDVYMKKHDNTLEALLSILVAYRVILINMYEDNMLKVPSHNVEKATYEYKYSQNKIAKFCVECCVNVKRELLSDFKDEVDYSSDLKTVASTYSIWYTVNVDSKTPKNKSILEDLLISMISKYIVKDNRNRPFLKGIRLLSMNEDPKSYEEYTFASKQDYQRSESEYEDGFNNNNFCGVEDMTWEKVLDHVSDHYKRITSK